MRKFGLIGKSLTHSFSKKYFTQKFEQQQLINCVYKNFELATIESLKALLTENPNIEGLNVTIPYKETIVKSMDWLSADAKSIGAVNCVKIANGKLIGFNTDALGFETALQQLIGNLKPFCFILGTGGSSKAVVHILKKNNLPYILVSRQFKEGQTTYSSIAQHLTPANLFINTTPLGMFPDINNCPDIPYHLLSEKDFLFDLTYNPAESLFLKKGKEQHCKTMNGQLMLEVQAEESWKIWNS
ncbi:MAG: shikimate dehydrogenase [Chitinophagales bacterium]|nr:shikimate dehydrogenase [Chitinophagales bacterium]